MALKALGLDKLIKVVKSLPKQIRFATSQTINQTLIIAQKAEFEGSNKAFTIRKPWNKPRTRFGFNIKFSKKDNLTGVLGSISPWLRGQTDKVRSTKDRDYGHFKPQYIASSFIAKKKGAKTPKRFQVQNLRENLEKENAFESKKGHFFKRKSPSQVIPLLWKTDTAKLDGPFAFSKIADTVIGKNFDKLFDKNFLNALRTAK